MLDYRYYLNAYARQEKRFFEISQHITINHAQLNVYSAELADHIVNSVSLIEGISNELYAKICLDIKANMTEDQIETLVKQGFPYSKDISINDREAFETKSLRALEFLWQLSHKQLQINAYSINLTPGYTITPFRYAYLTQKEIDILRKKLNNYKISRPLWSEAYRSNKHNRLDSLKPYYLNIDDQIKIATDVTYKFNDILEKISFYIKQEKTFLDGAKKISSKDHLDDSDKSLLLKFSADLDDFKDNIISLEDKVSKIDRETKPTVKAALEAMGALYILCIYARYVQDDFYQNHEAYEVCNLIDFDPCMESKLFITVPYEAVIDNPCLPVNNDSLKGFCNISNSLFIQKDQQSLFNLILGLEFYSRNKKLDESIINFIPEKMHFFIDNDQINIISPTFDFSFDEYKAFSKQKAATTLMLLGYPRKIVLNTYCHTRIETVQKQGKLTDISINSIVDDIYNYEDINQILDS